MQSPSKYGVYQTEITEEVARCGRATAEVRLCQCDDGLYRQAVAFEYQNGGGSGPISSSTPGFETLDQARTAGLEELIWRFDRWQPSGHSEDSNQEVAELLRQLKARLAQPSLFDLIT